MIRVMQVAQPGEGPAQVLLAGAELDDAVRRPQPGSLRWLDVCGGTPAELELLGGRFGFHPLTLEDCQHFDQRPKLEEYTSAEPYLFVVIHNFKKEVLPLAEGRHQPQAGPAQPDAAEDADGGTLIRPEATVVLTDEERFQVLPLEVHAFVGRGYLVTVHEQTSAPLEAVWRRVAGEGALLRRGTDFVYYLVADALCDSNFPVLEDLSDVLDSIEEAVLSRPASKHLHRIYQLRKALVNMRRVLSPQRDILALLSRHGGDQQGIIQPTTGPYFRDVFDHLVRINEGIESGRDLLGNCVDAYLSAVGQRTNEIMKQLTLLSCVMLPLTFITGFFGMNFEMLPTRSWPVFIGALALMFVMLPAGLVAWFRHKRWL